MPDWNGLATASGQCQAELFVAIVVDSSQATGMSRADRVRQPFIGAGLQVPCARHIFCGLDHGSNGSVTVTTQELDDDKREWQARFEATGQALHPRPYRAAGGRPQNHAAGRARPAKRAARGSGEHLPLAGAGALAAALAADGACKYFSPGKRIHEDLSLRQLLQPGFF